MVRVLRTDEVFKKLEVKAEAGRFLARRLGFEFTD
jgi:hypothetical protein